MLPAIYETNIPEQLNSALTDIKSNIICISAPTGIGKTFMCLREMANLHLSGVKCIGVMPFRISVKNMWNYLSNTCDINYDYSMRNDKSINKNNCRITTVGYFLEELLAHYCQRGLINTPHIIFCDEIHDSSWQTNLLIDIILWQQKLRAPIKLIMASATFNKNYAELNPKMLAIPQSNNNTKIIFTKQDFPSMTSELYHEMIHCINHILTETLYGDILVIVPGQEEISKLFKMIDYFDILIYQLHSNNSDIGILQCDHKRKLIIATNIVENAITIPRLRFLIDSGWRRISITDHDGIIKLDTVRTSQSNLIQSIGRVGRTLNVQSFAFIMMMNSTYENLTDHSVDIPIHQQLLKLIVNKLPYKEILIKVDSEKINQNIIFLTHQGMIQSGNATKIGYITCNIPLSYHHAKFIAYVMMNYETQYYYVAILLAVWADHGKISNLVDFYDSPAVNHVIDVLNKMGYKIKIIEKNQIDDSIKMLIPALKHSYINQIFKYVDRKIQREGFPGNYVLDKKIIPKNNRFISLSLRQINNKIIISHIIPIPEEKTFEMCICM